MVIFFRRAVTFYAIFIGCLVRSNADDASDHAEENMEVHAKDPHGCSEMHAGEHSLSGYQFLQRQAQLNLHMTNVNLLHGYNASLGDDIECLTMRVDGLDEQSHEVAVTVFYKWRNDDSWNSFGQTFKFTDSDVCNVMESMELSGAPSGTYEFRYNTLGCAVVVVTKFGNRMPEVADPEAKTKDTLHTDENAHEKKNEDGTNNRNSNLECMLWATRGSDRGVQICCEPYFSTNCDTKNKKYEDTPGKCPPPTEEKEEL